MSPRSSAADAARTRERIVDHALTLGSADGLERLSFGRVAAGAELSKSGVARHFSTKEELQLAALDAGRRLFSERVWDPVAERRPGRERLEALMGAWLAYLQSCPLPGGCLVTAAATEFDGRPGPVREAIVADSARWQRVLERDAEVAVRARELPADTDVAGLAFSLLGVALATNQAAQLHGDPSAAARGLQAAARLLAPGS